MGNELGYSMTVKLAPLIQMPTAWTGMADRFGVHLFEGRLTISDMERLEVNGSTWHRKNPDRKTVELVVIFPSNARMTTEERTRMAELIKRWAHRRAASATTILAEGIGGAMQRSVLTGLWFLAPPPHPAKVFGKIADAVRWITPHVQSVLGEATSRAEIQSAVDEFCSDFRRRETRPITAE